MKASVERRTRRSGCRRVKPLAQYDVYKSEAFQEWCKSLCDAFMVAGEKDEDVERGCDLLKAIE